MDFSESGWQIKFPDQWWVKKFDEHKYYRTLSGKGFKGVDFVIIVPGTGLVLLEVKYFYQSLPTSEHLGMVYCEKIIDSLKVIELIHKYLSRQFLFNWLKPVIWKQPRWFGEWGFWLRAYNYSIHAESTNFVFLFDADMDMPSDKIAIQNIVDHQLKNLGLFQILPNTVIPDWLKLIELAR